MFSEINAKDNAIVQHADHHNLNSIQKKRKSSVTSKMAFLLVGVIVLLVAGVKLYKTFNSEDKSKVSATPVETVNTVAKSRSNLGTEFNPLEPDTVQVNNVETATDKPVEEKGSNQEQPVFKKYMSIPITQGSARQNATKSREESKPVSAAEQNKKEAVSQKNEAKPMSAVAINLDPNLYIQANTYIPCVLPFRFVSDVAGKVSCIITEDVYSANGNVKLIEKGTKANGQYKTGTLAHGQGRMFVIWTQLRTPDFKKVSLVDTAAYGELGEAGIDGWIDSHFWERFGGSLMLSMIQDVTAAAANSAPSKDRNVDYTENSRAALSEMAKVALENSINIPPTMYKNQGDIIGIVVGDDIDFSGVYQLKAKQ